MFAPRHTLFGLVLLATAARAELIVVDASGAGDFVDLQAAVDAASDGDVLLVRDGVYVAPLIAGRALTLVGEVGGTARLDGVTDVLAVSADQLVVLSGLELRGRAFSPALRVTACAGPVRLQDCRVAGADAPEFLGGDEPPGQFAAGPGVCVHACEDVAFVACTITGGDGGDHVAGSAAGSPAGQGRDALEASAAVLTLERCTLVGGDGGGALFGGVGGEPGPGLSHFGQALIAARCLFVGGAGGAGTSACSDGAPALRISGTDAVELGCTFTGGAAGGAGCLDGPEVEGSIAALRGAQRGLAAPRVVVSGQPLELQVAGRPGDMVRVHHAAETALRPRLDAGGAWLLAEPSTALPPAGPVPGSGVLHVPLAAPSVPPGDAELLFLQAVLVSAPGAPTLSNAVVVVVVGS